MLFFLWIMKNKHFCWLARLGWKLHPRGRIWDGDDGRKTNRPSDLPARIYAVHSNSASFILIHWNTRSTTLKGTIFESDYRNTKLHTETVYAKRDRRENLKNNLTFLTSSNLRRDDTLYATEMHATPAGIEFGTSGPRDPNWFTTREPGYHEMWEILCNLTLIWGKCVRWKCCVMLTFRSTTLLNGRRKWSKTYVSVRGVCAWADEKHVLWFAYIRKNVFFSIENVFSTFKK